MSATALSIKAPEAEGVEQPRPLRWLAAVSVGAPAVLLGVMAWWHRWTMDDGFIFFRVVDQLVHGNGPVFNAGERVEAATSPLWVAVLAVARLALPDGIALEEIALWLGLLASVFGLAAAGLGSLRLARVVRDGRRALVLPYGSLVVASITAFWDYATAGLETGLVLAWLGGSTWALAGFAQSTDAARNRWRWLLAILLGLGPLIRPDLALYSAAFLVALLIVDDRRSRWRMLGVLAVAAALPLAYQLFRMGYYASLVPNAALTKQASSSDWDLGLDYIGEMARSYHLWWIAVPIGLAYVWLGFRLWSTQRRHLALVAAPVLAAALHTVYIVRVGGDFMHGRLVLPAVFAVCCPVAVVAVERVVLAAAAAWVGAWALVCGITFGPIGTAYVGDQRAFYVAESGAAHPVTLDDYNEFIWYDLAIRARAYADSGRRIAFIPGVGASPRQQAKGHFGDPERVLPLKRSLDADAGLAFTAIGVAGYAAGPDIFVLDRLGLADPLGSRIRPRRFEMVGHRKSLSLSWIEARLTSPTPDLDLPLRGFATAAGRRALRCGELQDLIEDVDGPLTVGRFLGNVVDSFENTSLEVPNDPVKAVERFC